MTECFIGEPSLRLREMRLRFNSAELFTIISSATTIEYALANPLLLEIKGRSRQIYRASQGNAASGIDDYRGAIGPILKNKDAFIGSLGRRAKVRAGIAVERDRLQKRYRLTPMNLKGR